MGQGAGSAGSLPPSDATGQALFEAILEEKYVALFLNIEIWNDWIRTGLPRLKPYSGRQIPRRILYGSVERNGNPNIPPPDRQPLRSANDA